MSKEYIPVIFAKAPNRRVFKMGNPAIRRSFFMEIPVASTIHTSRSGLKTLIVDESSAGGQVKTTHQVANYPGFINPISGYELANNMKEQARSYGTEFELVSLAFRLVPLLALPALLRLVQPWQTPQCTRHSFLQRR